MACDSYLHIGDFVGAHGLKGTLIVYSHTRPANAVAGYSCWRIGKTAESATVYSVKRCWQHGKRTLVELDGVNDCNQAESFKGLKIWIAASEVETDDDEYLWEELIGCIVLRQANDEVLGTVTALEEYGAQDNLVVRSADDAETQGEWLIPFTEQTVIGVDLEEGIIVVDLPDGMDVCFTPKF
ncbi:16S rRNA processing protein RimM [Mariprofundus ferrooxydans]|nr:16S rRNA processing protein RimM [Mariprofundus ferrooxydans]